MIRKIYLSIFSITISLNFFSQDYEKLNPIEKPKKNPNNLVQDFNKHSVSFDIGGKDGVRYIGITSTKLTQLNSYVLGYRYMLNNRFGISPELGWERFKDLKDSIGTSHYMRFSIQSFYNLTDILRFNSFSNRLGMMAISGFGYSIGFNPSGVVSLSDSNNYALLGNEKIDKTIHGYFGGRVMFKVTNKISIHSTVASVFNLRQNRTFDGQRKLGGIGFTGKYYNLTLGASYYIGKDKQHADWFSSKVQEKDKFLDLNSEIVALKKSMEDDDRDGVINAIDEEPNTEEGSIVNNKGVSISVDLIKVGADSDGDGITDENDICPKLAGSANGCPDADKDGVADFMDACPDVLGSLKFNGCIQSDFGSVGGVSSSNGILEENGVYDVLFEFDKFELLPSGKEILDRLAKLMKDNKDFIVVVSGHADNVGTKVYNEGLSKRRAEICVKYLIDSGINPQRLITEFYGYDMEKYNSENKELKLANRRVSFKIK